MTTPEEHLKFADDLAHCLETLTPIEAHHREQAGEEPPPDPDPEPDEDIIPSGGNWSDPANWPNGVLPTAETPVTINQDMVWDAGECKSLTIEAGATVTITGQVKAHGSVVVHGTIQGEVFRLSFMVEDDRTALGAHDITPDPHTSGIGLWIMDGGKCLFRGNEVEQFRKIKFRGSSLSLEPKADSPMMEEFQQAPAVVAVSDTEYQLNMEGDTLPTGWKTGDTILVINEWGEHCIGQISHGPMIHSVEAGPHIRFTLIETNGGHEANVVYRDGEVVASPRACLLSRSAVIDAPLCVEGDVNHRAHTVALNGADVEYQNVEFRNLGPREKLGLYPVHAHHGIDNTSVLVENCAIWQDCNEPGNRCVTIHHTNGATIRNNTGFHSVGSMFFCETLEETGNTFEGNIGCHAVLNEELPDVVGDPHRSRIDFSHVFWLCSGNTIRNNFSAQAAFWRVHPTGNKIVGEGAGIVVKDLTGTPQIVEGHAHFGGSVGAWSEGDCTFNDLKVVHASGAMFPSKPHEIQRVSKATWLACNSGAAGYAYPGYEVNDSLIVCRDTAQVQGETEDLFHNCTVRCERLVGAESSRIAIGLDQCDVQAVAGIVLSRTHKTLWGDFPIVVLKSCSGRFYGEPIERDIWLTSNDPHQHPYSMSDGFARDETTWQLNNPPEPAGRVSSSARWLTMTATGFDEPPISQNKLFSSDRFGHTEFFNNYPGFPPGDYVARMYNKSREVLAEETVQIVSGEVKHVSF